MSVLLRDVLRREGEHTLDSNAQYSAACFIEVGLVLIPTSRCIRRRLERHGLADVQSQRREAQPNRTCVVPLELGFNRRDQLARGRPFAAARADSRGILLPFDPVVIRVRAVIFGFLISAYSTVESSKLS
jgi:hypothetical protein